VSSSENTTNSIPSLYNTSYENKKTVILLITEEGLTACLPVQIMCHKAGFCDSFDFVKPVVQLADGVSRKCEVSN